MSDEVAVPALEIADLLAAADFAVKIRIERAIGINYKRLQLLRSVSLCPEMVINEHAKCLGIEGSHASYHFRALAKANCIETYSNGQSSALNRRLVFYRITRAGEDYLSRMRRKAAEAARDAMDGKELRLLCEVLSRYAVAE